MYKVSGLKVLTAMYEATTCTSDMFFVEATELMFNGNFVCMFVVDDCGVLVGILFCGDIMCRIF